jgi:hypothetical protein
MSISQGPVGYTYAQVEAILRELHFIRDDRKPAFASRLKHLKKLGFPKGVNVGKGQRFSYSPPQLWILALAFEFVELGILPERIVAGFNQHARILVHATAQAVVPMFHPSQAETDIVPTVLIFDPSSLSELMDSRYFDALDPAVGNFTFGGPDMATWALEGHFPSRRISAVALHRLLYDMGHALERVRTGSRLEFLKELAIWSDSFNAEAVITI